MKIYKSLLTPNYYRVHDSGLIEWSNDEGSSWERALRSFTPEHFSNYPQRFELLSPPAPDKQKGEKPKLAAGQAWKCRDGDSLVLLHSSAGYRCVPQGMSWNAIEHYSDDGVSLCPGVDEKINRDCDLVEFLGWAPGYGPDASSVPPIEHKAVCVPESPKSEPQWSSRDSDGLTFTDRKMLISRVERQKADKAAAEQNAKDADELKFTEECIRGAFDKDLYMPEYCKLTGHKPD